VEDSSKIMYILIREANRQGKGLALRSFACWCARQTEIEKGTSNLIRLAEDYILGKATLEDLQKLKSDVQGTSVAAGTIGMRHRFPNAPAFLCAFLTLSDTDMGAALSCSSYHRTFEIFCDEDWNDEKEKDLYWRQTFQLLRLLSMPFPGSADHLAPVHSLN
jgi:hypothetical protein